MHELICSEEQDSCCLRIMLFLLKCLTEWCEGKKFCLSALLKEKHEILYTFFNLILYLNIWGEPIIVCVYVYYINLHIFGSSCVAVKHCVCVFW